MASQVKGEMFLRDVASLLSSQLEDLRVGEEPKAEKGTAVAVKGIARAMCDRNVYWDSCDSLASGPYWVCWADWIISEAHIQANLNEYTLAWMNANLADRRFDKRLPRRPLLAFKQMWRYMRASSCPVSRYRAVLHENGILTTWKLEILA